MGFKRTGVFCTFDERVRLFKMAKEAGSTPAIRLSMSTEDWSTQAWNGVQKECHRLALSHGLSEFKGFYGLTQEGEFVIAEESDERVP